MIRLAQASPNHGPRRGVSAPDCVILHYTDMLCPEGALARLCDPAAEVSAHHLVAEDGRIWSLVSETERAWHAGLSFWGGERDMNSRSIGIELANPGHGNGHAPFPAPQMRALEGLLREIFARWSIAPERVLAHSDVAPRRKQDPGPRFDWRGLARHGLSIWPEAAEPRGEGEILSDPGAILPFAARFGYEVGEDLGRNGRTPPDPGGHGPQTPIPEILRALRLRFRPQFPCEALESPADARDLAILQELAFRWPSA
ncbi:N-acetylmuramoyl-L-alanine amidase [Neomegalonema sp.]|uniref:N-acetylmuramoyl-L-alanine amidase n=1 Tax=Neomegalonema sp. TaxID=2039713 RepID=UPI00262436FF|nr:N-acetylmuramoyl-L-alanine amidase [Neomegalonema sp.]MDD2868948.1 N-acetylmuramoyl-L-alanine amidase [Neomegalonema sp.]